jgi:hypothetical protein
MPLLNAEYEPAIISIELAGVSSAIDAVQQELTERALQTPSRCYGYFPDVKEEGVRRDLPACEAFADNLPTVQVNGQYLGFNFLRMSLVKQEAKAHFHIDTDLASGFGGERRYVLTRRVWRLILNLSSVNDRRIAYSSQHPESIPLVDEDGYVHCPSGYIDERAMTILSIRPRVRDTIYGALLCVSQVLHSGQDDELGHFVASYGEDRRV